MSPVTLTSMTPAQEEGWQMATDSCHCLGILRGSRFRNSTFDVLWKRPRGGDKVGIEEVANR